MVDIEDYSYSGVVNRINGDSKKGIEEIKKAINTLIFLNSSYDETDRKLKIISGDRDHVVHGIRTICKHLGIDFPVTIVINDSVVTISHSGVMEFRKIINPNETTGNH